MAGAYRRAALVLALFTVLAVAVTWPMATRPDRLSFQNEDTYSNMWVIAWVVHQAVRDPLNLFEANIYYPHRHSLAFLESQLPQALQAAPVLLLGGSPVLAHNLLLIATFALSGVAAYALARDLGCVRSGSLLAGIGYAFCAFRYDHAVHLQCLSVQWLPLALLFLRRSIRGPSRWNLAGLAVSALFQALSSGYYALLVAVALGVALAVEGREALQRRSLPKVVLALVAAAVLAGLTFLPYRAIQNRQGMARKRAEYLHWSARWSSYVDPGKYPSMPYLDWMRRATQNRAPLYPGAAVLVLAAIGAAGIRRSTPARLAAALAATGVLLSLGPEIQVGGATVPGPFELLRLLPGGSIIRVPSRMGILGILGLDLLAALGWTWLAARFQWRPKAEWAGAVALCAFAFAEGYPAALSYTVKAIPEPPPSAHWLATAPRGPVLEIPWDDPRLGGLYEYWSTAHWQPMINGWGGMEPPGNHGLGFIGRGWPSRYSARILKENGVRYVVAHVDRLSDEQRQRLTGMGESSLPEGVRIAAVLGHDWIYTID